MSELKHTFTSGRMNKDLDERLIPNGEYRDALNIQVSTSEGSDVGAIENVLGNKELFNLNLTNALCIGTAKDLLNKKIYWFVTADELDGIFEYDTLNDVIAPILIDTKNTNIDVINSVSFLSNEDQHLVISNNFNAEFEKIFGIETLPTILNQEALVTKNVSISIQNIETTISIPKGTIICLNEDDNFIFKNINYELQDLGDLVVTFTHSDGAILSFLKNNFINGANIIDGLLFFTDNLNEPRVIDIQKFKKYSKKLINTNGNILTNISTSIDVYGKGQRELLEEDITVAVKAPQACPDVEIKNTLRDGQVSEILPNFNFFSTGQSTNNKLILPNDQNNTFKINYSSTLDWKIGDNISFEPTGDTDDFSAIATIKLIEVGPIITFQILSYINRENIEDKGYEIEQTLVQDDSIYELKFPRFGYRWKYKDNRFSAFSPFSEPAFFPDEFKYDGKKGFNEGVINQTKKILLKNINQGTDLVKQIDILLKFDDDNNVYILESKKKKYIDIDYIFEITKEQIKSTVDNKQLLRQWDNIPKRAKTQEITGNRIIYGNYFQNYNIYDDPKFEITLVGREDNFKRSLKTNRNYEIGVVYIDKFNRQTPVLSDETGSYFINKNQAPNENAFNIKLMNNPPAWATHFKYFIKETSAEYYNLAADRFYFDNKNGYVYISFSSAERNKITEDTYLFVKKVHGEDVPITDANNRFKVLEIFSEPPEFVHERITKIDALSNVLFATAFGANDVQATKSAGLTPVKDNITVQIHSVATDGTTASGTNLTDYGFDEITKTNLKVGKYIRFEAGGKRTNKYQIKALRYHASGEDELELKVEKPFGDDVNILYSDSTDNLKGSITLEIYEDKAFAGDPEFNGRFFVKLEINNTLNAVVPENEAIDGNIKYHAAMSVNVDGKDRSSRNFEQDSVKGIPVFINGGGGLPGDPNNITRYSEFTGDKKQAHIVFEQTGPSDQSGAEFINKIELGDRIKFSNQDTLYRVGRTQKEFSKFVKLRSEGWKGSTKHPVWQIKILFTEEDGTETPLQKKVATLDPKNGLDVPITVSIMRPSEDEKSVFTPNPAIFETEPVRQKTELDIYFETEKAFPIEEHGLNQKLNWYNCFSFGNGVESNRIRDDFNAPFLKNGVKASTVLEEGYEEEHKFNGLIFSGIVNSKSSVNNSNQFLQAESITKDFLPSYGRIQKLHSWDDSLVVFLENKILRTPANKSALFNADGSTNLIASSNVIGNPIEYNGEYGISNDPQSFAFFGFRCYFVDRKNGKVFRLSKDGLTPISDVNMGDFFSDRLETTQTIFGSFDEDNQLYNLSFGTDADTVCFSEAVNGWTTRKSFVPEFAISINSKYYTFKNSNLFLHGHSAAIRNNFYGVQGFSQVQFEINDDPSTIKKFRTLVYEGTKGWTADIKTDLEKSNNISFKRKENKYFANISGESKTISNLDLKKFNFQGIGRPSSIDTIVDSRPNTTYNFTVSSSLSNLDIGSKSLPSKKPGESILTGTVKINIKPNSDRFKLVSTDFSGTNCVFQQNGDGITLIYTHGFILYPTVTTDIIIPIVGGRLIEKDVTLSGEYDVNLSGCTASEGKNTYSITGKPGSIVNIISRNIEANANFKLLKSDITIDNTLIANNSSIIQNTNNDTFVTVVEKTVLPSTDQSGRNYIIKAIATEVKTQSKILINKIVPGPFELANSYEAREIIVIGDPGAKILYDFKEGSNLIKQESLTIPDSKEINIFLIFDTTTTNFDLAKTFTVTFKSGDNTEFGLNFGDQILTFERKAVTNHGVKLKVIHDDISTAKKYALRDYSVSSVGNFLLTNQSISLTLNSSFAYGINTQKILNQAVDEFKSLTQLDNNFDSKGLNVITFKNIKLDVGTGSNDHIITLIYDIEVTDITTDHEFELNLNNFVNKIVTLTFAYAADTGGTETVGSSGNYTAVVGSFNSPQTRQGVTNSFANAVDTFIVLTCNSNNEFEDSLTPPNATTKFKLFDSSNNDVTEEFTDKKEIAYNVDTVNNTATISLRTIGFNFPAANTTLTVRPTAPIVRTPVAVTNNFTFTIENLYGLAVKAPSIGTNLDEIKELRSKQFVGSSTGKPWIARDSRGGSKNLINGPKSTKTITETSSDANLRRLAQFEYTFNRAADYLRLEEGFSRICKFGNASTYSSSYTLTGIGSASSYFELAPNGNSTQTDINGASKTITGPFEISNNGTTIVVNVLLKIAAITTAQVSSAEAKLQVALDMEEDVKIVSGNIKNTKDEACKSSTKLNTLIWNPTPGTNTIAPEAWIKVFNVPGAKPWNLSGSGGAANTFIKSRESKFVKDFTNDKIIKIKTSSNIQEYPINLCPGQLGPIRHFYLRELFLNKTMTTIRSSSLPDPWPGGRVNAFIDYDNIPSNEKVPYEGSKKLSVLRKQYVSHATHGVNDDFLRTNYPNLFVAKSGGGTKFDINQVSGGNNVGPIPKRNSDLSFAATAIQFKGNNISELFSDENFVGVYNYFTDNFMSSRSNTRTLNNERNNNPRVASFPGDLFIENHLVSALKDVTPNPGVSYVHIGLRGVKYYKLLNPEVHKVDKNNIILLLNDVYVSRGGQTGGVELQFYFRKRGFANLSEVAISRAYRADISLIPLTLDKIRAQKFHERFSNFLYLDLPSSKYPYNVTGQYGWHTGPTNTPNLKNE